MAVSFRRATFQQVRGSAGVVLILLGLVVSRGRRWCFGLMGAAGQQKMIASMAGSSMMFLSKSAVIVSKDPGACSTGCCRCFGDVI
jgi:hypothetical protein